jgi:hypothetical protein
MRTACEGPRRATHANLRKRSSKQTLASLRCRPRSTGCYQAIRPVPMPVPAWPLITRAFHANAIEHMKPSPRPAEPAPGRARLSRRGCRRDRPTAARMSFRGSFALKDLLVAHKMRPGWPAVRAPIDHAIVIAAHRGPARSSCAVNRRSPTRVPQSAQKIRPGCTGGTVRGRGLGGLQSPCRARRDRLVVPAAE